MNYVEEVVKGMNLIMERPNSLVLGQAVAYPGNVVYKTLGHIPAEKKLEMPVFEEQQMGMSIGLALAGFLPLSVFPRFNFLLLAVNQLVNHLDKLPVISKGGFKPKVIIKTMVGATTPLHPGIQHCGDFTEAFRLMLDTVAVEDLRTPADVLPAYQRALDREYSTIIVEHGNQYSA